MTAVIVPFPVGYPEGRQGPAGPLIDEIAEQEELLKDLLDNYPYGSEFDPRAGVSRATLVELRVVVWLLAAANKLIERADAREDKYRLESGWPNPED